jgi:hypothetical protein
MMDLNRKTGIEIRYRDSGKRIGVIEILPQGVLIYRVISKDLFPSALRPIEFFLKKNGLEIPLYLKYEKLLKQHGELPGEVIFEEAMIIAEIINRGNLRIGEKVVEARFVNYHETSFTF